MNFSMKNLLFFGTLSLLTACDFLTEKEEDEEEDEDSIYHEGDRQGDCLDGEDNDEDGYIDCEDQDCDGKPACTESTDTADTDNPLEDGTPCINISPSVINFGDLDATQGFSAQEVVSVYNCGDGQLHIEDLYLGNSDAPFSVNSISTPLIPPEGEAQFSVDFYPQTAGTFQDYVYIESNAPDTPVAEVQLNGVGIASVIDISPSDYDFGSLYVGCESSQTLTISNIGNNDLIVSSFNFSTTSNDLTFDGNESMNGSLPWTISPSDSRDVFIDYAPLDEMTDIAFLTVTSNDPAHPEDLVEQGGTGIIYAENSDSFETSAQIATDILFAFDRSCSMDDNTGYITSSFGSLITELSSLGADYHIAAVVGDSGCINPGGVTYIDNTYSASQATTIIEQMIDINSQNIGYGSNEERAFMQFEAALGEAVDMNGQPLTTGCNYGLIRENAKLNLIAVSDEPEQSYNSYTHYVSLFQSLKSDPDDVVIHGIGGDYPGGCSSAGGSADPFTGVYEASVATGGQLFSICETDWTTHFETIAALSTPEITSYLLTENPVPNTIVVKINGTVTTSGWTYDSAGNKIVFSSGYEPVGGDMVQVDYAIFGECEE